ncbi:MAG: hypothetical protein EOP88_02375 [Verrucomicrobiaceae bacterium]|nr:MAG: hypothetical protein EOP88_02375 [Verrucomicrobiaceae bacterium]
MKPNHKTNRFLSIARCGSLSVVFTAFSIHSATAAVIEKANNANALNLSSSWTGAVVPGPDDVAEWSFTVAGANSAVLGANLAWKGITLGSPGGAVTIGAGNVLTLGTSGIDLSASSQDLTVNSGLTLAGGGQSWNVPLDRTLTLGAGSFTHSSGSSLAIVNDGAVATSMTGLVNTNSIIGPWAKIVTAGVPAYATLSGTNLMGFVGTASGFNWTTTNDNTFNYDVSGTAANIGLNRTANTIRYTGIAATQNYGSNGTATVTLNGLMNAGAGPLTLSETGGTNQGQVAIGTNNGNELVLDAATANIFINIPIINTGANVGSVLVTGSNTVTITSSGGVSTYTGATTVAGGTLHVSGAGSINTTSGVSIRGIGAKYVHTSSVAGTFPVTLTEGTLDGAGSMGAVTVADSPDAVLANGNGGLASLALTSLAFGGDATVNVRLNAGSAAVAVSGSVSTTPAKGLVKINVNAAGLPNGTHPVISSSALAGSVSDFVLGDVTGTSSRQSTSLQLSGTNLVLQVAGDSPKWTGAVDGRWTTDTISNPKNWKLVTAGTGTDFIDNDNVLFDDTATGTTTLDIADGNVPTGSVTFNNTTKPYIVGSSNGYGISSGSLVKNGTNTVTLLSENTYAGTTTINAGILRLGDGVIDGGIAAASAIVNNASLVLDRTNGTFTHTGVISGTGSLTKTGAAIQTLSGANTYAGGTTVGAGTLNANSATALGTGSVSVASGATLGLNTPMTLVQAFSGAGNIIATNTITVSTADFSGFSGTYTHNTVGASTGFQSASTTSKNANYVIASAEGASQGVIASGNGDYTLEMGSLSGVTGSLLRGGNVATGTTIVQVGNLGTDTVMLGAIRNGATKIIGLTKVGSGKFTLAAANTYTAATTISGGTLQLGDGTTDGTIATTSGVTNNAALVYNWVGSASATYVISGTGTLTKDGAGTLTLGGTNTYTGATTINAGKIVVDGDSIADAGAVAINGTGAMEVSGTEVVNSLSFSGVPQASGTWGSSTSGATHVDDARFTGSGVLSVTTGSSGGSAYTTWASSKGLTASNNGAAQDPDFDGISNSLEFVLGGNPLASDTGKQPTLSTTATDFIFTFTRADESEAEISLVFQHGSSLTGWVDVPVGAASSGPVVVTENAASPDSVVVTISKSLATGGKLFGRLRSVK